MNGKQFSKRSICSINRKILFCSKRNEKMTTDEAKLKEIFRGVVSEVLEEKKEMLYSIFFEALEDAAMINAIKEGEASGVADRNEVYSILNKK
jgi:hypothetical protein